MKGNKMRFNISMQSDKMGEGHRDKDFSETILLAINGMASGCDIKITKVKESMEEK